MAGCWSGLTGWFRKPCEAKVSRGFKSLPFRILEKFEFSAGGIVYKKESGKMFVLVAQHSGHHGGVFPKGIIGDHKKGEKKEETAVREVQEETGIKGKIIKPLQPVTYWYNFEGEKIKAVEFYYD